MAISPATHALLPCKPPPLPHMPPATQTPPPCMPPCHACPHQACPTPCHTCPPATHAPCHACPHQACPTPLPHMPSTTHAPCHACPLPHMPPAKHAPPATHAPWTEFLTHTCENITLPQLRAGGNNRLAPTSPRPHHHQAPNHPTTLFAPPTLPISLLKLSHTCAHSCPHLSLLVPTHTCFPICFSIFLSKCHMIKGYSSTSKVWPLISQCFHNISLRFYR